MSPVPPPAGAFIPSDDWTDDPSFDLSPGAHTFALPSSPSGSSSTSHRSRHSITASTSSLHGSSPLRQAQVTQKPRGGPGVRTSYAGPSSTLDRKGQVEAEEDDFAFDLPDSFPAATSSTPFGVALTETAIAAGQPITPASLVPRRTLIPSSSSSASSRSLKTLSKTVIGSAPSGVGIITRLGGGGGGPKGASSTTTPSTLDRGTIRAKASAVALSWEMDVDLGEIVEGPRRRLTLSPPKRTGRVMPSADDLDDLGFDLDAEDDNEATLKAGSTIKALLPPPKPRPPPSQAHRIRTPPTQDPESADLDLDAEMDLVLPLNLTNLNLVSSKSRHAPRHSNASTTNLDWDSPGTATSASGKKSTSSWSWEDSPNDKKRYSETSATSVSDGLGNLGTPYSSSKGLGAKEKDNAGEQSGSVGYGEEDDMELGLVLPSPTFFSTQRAKELNSILDKKRKPQFAIQTSTHRRTGTDETFRTGDDSIEDGLVLDDPKVELSNHRLSKGKRARSILPLPGKKGAGTRTQIAEKDRSWEKQREQGWGRPAPAPAPSSSIVRDRTQSTFGLALTGHRSHSASATTTLRNLTASRPVTPLETLREKDTPRSRSGQAMLTLTSMPPPAPPPPVTVPPATPSSSSRLRHQKSHYHMPSQSPSLARKQSLSSLQDQFTSHPHPHPQPSGQPPPLPSPIAERPETPSSSRYHNSTSRLTMPTSSSKAKAKSRLPVSAIFPRDSFPAGGSGGSVPSAESREGVGSRLRRGLEMYAPKRRVWGNGSELEGIEDLEVDDKKGSIGSGRTSKKGHDSGSKASNLLKEKEKDGSLRKKSGIGAKDKEREKDKDGTHHGSLGKKRTKRPALLIKHLGGGEKKKVVGDMTWNPQTLRWEGNEGILRDFDNIPTSSSSRPALITHLTGSSSQITSPTGINPSTSAHGTVRIVGDMRFDPERMCWVNLMPEEEVDPFEGMADDEDEEEGDKGGTIRATAVGGRRLVTVGMGSSTESSSWSSRMVSLTESAFSTKTTSTTYSSSGSDGDLRRECKEAEDRHRKEIRGWYSPASTSAGATAGSWGRDERRREEKRLWEIRKLASGA